MGKTRHVIFGIIKDKHAVTIKEICNILGLTPANVRHHLRSLSHENLVETIGSISNQRGRPAYVYGISQNKINNGLIFFLSILFKDYIKTIDREKKNLLLLGLAKKMKEALNITDKIPSHLYLTNLIEKLSALDYQAHWEAGETGVRLIFEQCPYNAIQKNQPELCVLDAYFLEELLGNPVVIQERLETSRKNLPRCVFITTRGLRIVNI